MEGDFPKQGEIINEYLFEDVILGLDTRKVYLASKQNRHNKYVIKVISFETENKERIDNETFLLLQLKCPTVLNAIDIFDIKGFRFLVTNLANGGDALSFAGNYDECFIKYIIYDILNALKYLHNLNVWHRDIKPENIFIQLNKNNSKRPLCAILGDLGFAKQFETGENLSEEYIGTLPFCSPQIVAHEPYSESTDIWSLGVTTYYMLYGCLPFEHDDERPLTDKLSIISGKYEFPKDKNVSDDAKFLISEMLRFTPEERVTAEEALQFEWFKDIDEECCDVCQDNIHSFFQEADNAAF